MNIANLTIFSSKIQYNLKPSIFLRREKLWEAKNAKKVILREDALTNSEEGVWALSQKLVLQGLETFTFLIDDK